MWVLDVVVSGDGGDVETSFYLVAGEWSVGRKHSHFNFPADSSISRKHALIRVGSLSPEQLGDSTSRPSLELVDQDSRFGTFVNQEQCIGARRLRHGDQISFGVKRTVLRVRYQVFVLVASRIHRANRAQVNDACQQLGMHLVSRESDHATHCIMDPGHVVATVKVLWALVYNQPVVCTPWIFAILSRSSLAEPLPRCEEYLPTDASVPSVENNYLPNPLRKTLFRGCVVVFLVPQSMQGLITAMDGIVVAAYEHNEQDNELLRELELHAATKRVLIVEPTQGSGFSSTAGQSDQQTDTGGAVACPVATVERRVNLFRSMGATFASVQELAASVIFVKPPSPSGDDSFCNSLASHAGSSIQIMSFPEHLSLRAPAEEDEDEAMEPVKEDQDAACLGTSKCTDRVHSPTAASEDASELLAVPSYDDVQMKSDTQEDNDINIVQIPIKRESKTVQAPMSLQPGAVVPPSPPLDRHERALAFPVQSGATKREASFDDLGWVSSRSLQGRDLKEFDNEETPGKPLVVSCELVVKKREPARRSNGGSGAGLMNYKRFKKGNSYTSRSSTASLFPEQMVVTVDNVERETLQENLEALEEQERIAEELFAMVEGRSSRKPF